jgi:integrase
MLLASVVDRIAMERTIEKVTVDQYVLHVNRFSESLGREATIDDLNEDAVNVFLLGLERRGFVGKTIHNHRGSIKVVWNYLTETERFPPYAIKRLRRTKVIKQPVFCWSVSQFRQLQRACDDIDQKMRNGMAVADFLRAWLWVGYQTGIRPSDMRLLRWDNLDTQINRMAIVQHKTSVPHSTPLPNESLSALERIRAPERELVFPLTKGGVRRWELLLYAMAKQHGFVRRKGQGLGTLRKVHATHVYIESGDSAAAESLGHIGGTRTVRESYIATEAFQRGRTPRMPDNDELRTVPTRCA